MTNLQRKIANSKEDLTKSTDSILESRDNKIFKFNPNEFRNKVSRDMVALSYFDAEFNGISENLKIVYGNLKGIGEELNIPISESLFKVELVPETKDTITTKMKSRLKADLTTKFIQPFNSKKLQTMYEPEIKNIVENSVGSNLELESDVITYAIFESVVTNFVKDVVYGKHGEQLIREYISKTNDEYFNTFDNNFRDKFNLINEKCQEISEALSPTLFKRITAVVGEAPKDIEVGISRKLNK